MSDLGPSSVASDAPEKEISVVCAAAAGAFASSPPDWRIDVMVVCPKAASTPLVIAALGALRRRRGG